MLNIKKDEKVVVEVDLEEEYSKRTCAEDESEIEMDDFEMES